MGFFSKLFGKSEEKLNPNHLYAPMAGAAVSVNDAKKVMRLIDRLEELEDLQSVYHTMDITDEIAEALDE